MIYLLLLLQTAQPHDALHYDITLIPSDTSTHVLSEVQITWRLGSARPVTMQLDSAMRVIRVLIDGKQNTRLSRTMYARSSTEIDVPHQKQPGDSISTRVRYRGRPRGGLRTGRTAQGDRTVVADNRADKLSYWIPTPGSPEDKATVAFHIQVPAAYKVTVPGKLEKVDTLAYGNVMWHFTLDQPVAVYTIPVSWVAGPQNKNVRSEK
jgi:aminopeptidase N